MNKDKTYQCEFELTVDLIGGKWRGLILWHLSEYETLRNTHMLKLMPNITQKMLTSQLREMEETGLVTRKVYEQVPPKVEYTLTEYGKKLKPILESMRNWGVEYSKKHEVKFTCKKKSLV